MTGWEVKQALDKTQQLSEILETQLWQLVQQHLNVAALQPMAFDRITYTVRHEQAVVKTP